VNKHTRMFRIVVLGAVLALTLAQASAWAETNQLSAKDQKIAQALFEAQGKSTGGTPPLTLDQIVAMKSHTGWGQVFKDMKSKGLLTQKNLGQAVSDFERHHPETAKVQRTDKPDKADKPAKPDKPEHMDRPDRPEKPGR
jgi:hypothetical protein